MRNRDKGRTETRDGESEGRTEWECLRVRVRAFARAYALVCVRETQ